MEIEYEYRFSLPRNLVWKFIKNEKILKNALPGCRSFAKLSNGVYNAEIEIYIGPIQDVFTIDIRLDEEKAPTLSRLFINGNGNMGQLNGNAILMLKENQGSTLLTCKATGQLTGALGLAGKRMIDSGAGKGIDKFFQNVEKEIKRYIYDLKRRNR
ncbi:CoxG family protein [Neobacillus cucumis]|uniref:CoxG family protein n=1 Tax=Neobacillus cucumis TaxID=1740721 RepID=UPI0028533401|nr:SRPBCC domain-containing protein [Neobacillus cucumis]MDR4946959.1 SRPBCC domain-containing protein [Neobacillus cucumis]